MCFLPISVKTSGRKLSNWPKIAVFIENISKIYKKTYPFEFGGGRGLLVFHKYLFFSLGRKSEYDTMRPHILRYVFKKNRNQRCMCICCSIEILCLHGYSLFWNKWTCMVKIKSECPIGEYVWGFCSNMFCNAKTAIDLFVDDLLATIVTRLTSSCPYWKC